MSMTFPSLTSFRLIKLSGLCLVLFLVSHSVSALELDVDTVESNTFNIDQYYDQYHKSVANTQANLFTVEKEGLTGIASMFKAFKKKYLTFYSSKNENLRATYSSGAYFIKYTSDWY